MHRLPRAAVLVVKFGKYQDAHSWETLQRSASLRHKNENDWHTLVRREALAKWAGPGKKAQVKTECTSCMSEVSTHQSSTHHLASLATLPSIFLSIHPCVYPPNLSIHPSFHLFIYLICLSIPTSLHPSTYISTHPSILPANRNSRRVSQE